VELSKISTRRGTPRVVRFALIVLAILTLAHLARSLLDGSSDRLFVSWLYGAVMVGCAAVCVARGVLVAEARPAWLFLGVSLGCDACGEILATVNESLLPGLQAALFLCFYLGSYVGIVLLGRRRVPRLRPSLWLDGLSGILAVSALGAAVLFGPVFASIHGSGWQAFLDISYPLADALLVGVVVGMLALAGWRFDRSFATIAIGFLVLAVADGIYLYQVAEESYVAGTPLDTLWLLAALILAYAAWQPDASPTRSTQSVMALLAGPVIAGITAIAVLAYGNLEHVGRLSIWLAVGTLLVVLLRLVATGVENVGLVRTSSELANRDPLTGLHNRRALFADLERAFELADRSDPLLLVLFDLNGFKQYNDTFGHPAGDALLARLGQKLEVQARPLGRSYRLGGDEFCALLKAGEDPALLAAELAAALLERGEGFTIGASYGEVLLGAETSDLNEALRIADQRLYAQKAVLPRAGSLEWKDVLLGVLREQDPDLDEHVQRVAELALQLGKRVEMAPGELKSLVAAAELHDIGKVAIPKAILDKPAELDADERTFIERHTVIGERILASAPRLAPIGAIVRATHERYDGDGYPDGVRGEEIPLAARIIAVCDAFHAMTSDRSYRSAMPIEDALDELHRCAGSQFDPDIVTEFWKLLANRRDRLGHDVARPQGNRAGQSSAVR
jgi:two-component system, cell cycle response regulator